MAEEKAEAKEVKTEAKPLAENERIYTIPLRKAFRKAYGKRTPYAVRIIQDYLGRHTKSKVIKLGRHLNEALWERGIKKPPRKVRVKAVKDGEAVKAELLGREYEEFRAAPKTEKKGMKEKLLERLGPKAAKKQEEEKLAEGEKKPEEAKAAAQPKMEAE